MAEKTMLKWVTQREIITSYVGPQRGGRSGKARCVHLYTDNLDWNVCTVWEEDFDRLPFGIGEAMKTGTILTGTAPTKERAKEDDMLQYCPAFEIDVWVEPQPDGSIVRKKKLAEIIGPAGTASARTAQARGRTAGVSADEVINKEFNPIPHDSVHDQMVVIAAETGVKFITVLEEYRAAIKAFQEAHDDDAEWEEISEETHRYLFGLMWRDANDMFRVVRPALMREREDDSWHSDAAAQAIEHGDADDFLADLADNHPMIIDAEHAKVILKDIGATGIPKDSDERVRLAMNAWLYVDLLSRHGFHKSKAKEIMENL